MMNAYDWMHVDVEEAEYRSTRWAAVKQLANNKEAGLTQLA
jgi:hypothetical protein